MSAKPKTTSRNYTLPILFALSVLLNYGQFSGWVTIANPENHSVSAVDLAAYDGDALPPVVPKIKGGF